ncbi:MAG: PEP-CTERM sorting domain-containing protein [Acidobacteria bacterium]|jgi:hypothetical protein|nr:PEP-CTERM sorting domain-containing protein [Acidobacteriota bacterium]
MKRVLQAMLAVALLVAPGRASADTIELASAVFNVDGALADSLVDGTPLSGVLPGLDDSAFDYVTGLGTISLTITGAGAHAVAGFFDVDILDPMGSNTFFDDSGEALGTAPAGLGWEVDEPGAVFGDILAHVMNGDPLDDAVFDGIITSDDVSMALGWNVVLAAGETAILTFATSLVDPGSGFRLRQFDASGDEVYLWSSIEVVAAPVPEPALLLLFGAGALGLAGRARRRAGGR